MAVVLQLATGVATKNGFINTKYVSDNKCSLKKNVNCVKAIARYPQTQNCSIDISFENISFSVSRGFRKGKKEILHKISGNFLSGQLVAIIGPSEAGKTTLLDVLSGYRTSVIEGTIYTEAHPRDLNTFKKQSCYITHDNNLQPLLTVWENMKFAADLKLGALVSQEDKDIRINQILSTLYMDTCASTTAKYLSGGQQKRLSIALELINNPTVMFLDEPTTGLDSSSCRQCIRLLRDLAKQGKTVVCALQQLSASHFELFDQLYVLGEGNCLYQGTVENVIPFLESLSLQCSKYHNPADFVIELAAGEYGKQHITTMTEAINNGKNCKWLEEETFSRKLKQLKEKQQHTNENFNLGGISQYNQFTTLLRRGFLKTRRDVTLTYLRLMVNLFNGLLYGTLYWQTGNHGGKVANNYSLLYCILIHHLMSTMMLTILTFPSEISILVKEHFNRWYSLKMYFTAITIVDIPMLVFCCLLFTSIVYFMTGQPLELHRMIMFTTISILVVLVVQSFGLVIGSTFNVVNGTFMGFSMSIPLMMLAGFGQALKELPVNLYWASYTSYMKYAFQGIITSIYGFDRPAIYCPDEYCHYKYPKKLLNVIEHTDQFWTDILGLCIMFILFRILAFVILKRKILNTG